MKKILFVANVGKEHILKFHVPTIKRFKDEGWTVDVACAGEDDIPFCDTQFRTCWKRSPFTPKTFSGIKELKGIIDRGNYDVIYCHTPVGGLVARIAAKDARKRGTKVIYYAHGLHFFKGAPIQNWLIFYPIEKWLSYKTDVFFALNQEDFDFATAHFNKQTDKRLMNGVGADFSRLDVDDAVAVRRQYRADLGITEDTTVLLYVAEIIKNKNQKMLVNALADLRKTHPNTKLLLVGPEHDGGALRSYIHTAGLDDHVQLLGWRSDIGALMRTADIYLASSLREGFPINLLEAMYGGLPVIASKNRGHVTAIRDGENGFLVDINDSAAMAQYARRLLDDPALYHQMSTVDVSRYNCDSIAKELYDTIVSYV